MKQLLAMFAMLAIALACCSVAAAQPAGETLSPWAVEDHLLAARGSSREQAVKAIRALARSRDAGQDALLRLLEEPEPPVGVDGVLDAIGAEWFDAGVRWAPRHRPRALRLSLEWVESIARADGAHRMAALEAMGTDADIEPILRPLLTAPADAVRRRAARFLLRINPEPTGMVRLLRRDLAAAVPADPRRIAIVQALVHLRPTSDATLAALLLDDDSLLATLALQSMLDAGQPPTNELIAATATLARRGNARLSEWAVAVLALGAYGREQLVEIALDPAVPSAALAREALRGPLPRSAGVFARLERTKQNADEHAAARRAAKRVLLGLNFDLVGLDLLTDDPDDEVAAQARIALAHDHYEMRLGPVTYRMIEPRPHAPESPPVWRSATTVPGGSAKLPLAAFSRALWWATLVSITLAAGAVLVLVGTRHKYDSSASERM